jgi:hypothetical protein
LFLHHPLLELVGPPEYDVCHAVLQLWPVSKHDLAPKLALVMAHGETMKCISIPLVCVVVHGCVGFLCRPAASIAHFTPNPSPEPWAQDPGRTPIYTLVSLTLTQNLSMPMLWSWILTWYTPTSPTTALHPCPGPQP